MKIINEDLVINHTVIDDLEILTLKNDTFLGDVIDFLPAGIIDKNITGIGATTLEIESKRDSIIVVPLKAIAYSKSKKHPNALYIGGAILGSKGINKNDVLRYTQSEEGFKKYLVVADSLPFLYQALGEKAFFKCFLMIDEVDSFQLDSSYRNKLENCLDYYKRFHPKKRALVSSTLMEFSDPELQNEYKKYIFNYKTYIPRSIIASSSENVLGSAFDYIGELVQGKPNEKIVIAYNAVEGSKAIAEKLVADFNLSKDDIKILCSSTRVYDAQPFYGELIDGILPGKINFLTSAYFVGVDIHESYHSIAICNPQLRYTLLSTNRLKQIAGRCRKPSILLSEVIFYGATHLDSDDILPIEELLLISETKIRSLKCISDNYQNHPQLAKQLIGIRELITKKEDVLDYSLVRIDFNGAFVPSFFNIDACLSQMHTLKSLYSGNDNLPNQLVQEGQEVTWRMIESSTSVQYISDKYTAEKAEIISNAIKKLKFLDRSADVKYLLKSSRSKEEAQIYERYQSLYPYFYDVPSLLEKLLELSKKDKRGYENYLDSLKASNDDVLRDKLIELFPIGSKHTNIDILEKLNLANAKCGLHHVHTSKNKAVQLLNSYFNVYKNKRELKDGLPLHEIKDLLFNESALTPWILQSALTPEEYDEKENS